MTECEICAGECDRECGACDGCGDDGYSSDGRCFECGGSGMVTPFHCCDCGGMPYCHCKTTGSGPIPVRMEDGTIKIL